jgi:thiol-disulfide isomerase/thioredoxin
VRRSLALLASVALLVACTHATGSGIGVVEENEPFPHLSGPTVAGGKLDTDSLAGTVFVLNVWATWCDPCRREQPALQRLHERYGGDVGFVGLDYRDDIAKAKAWARGFGVTYPSLFDPTGRFASDLAFPFAPDTYVVDATGTIRFVIYGETDEQELAGVIDRVLAMGSGSEAP